MGLKDAQDLKLVKVMKIVIRLINVKPHARHYKYVNLTFFGGASSPLFWFINMSI